MKSSARSDNKLTCRGVPWPRERTLTVLISGAVCTLPREQKIRVNKENWAAIKSDTRISRLSGAGLQAAVSANKNNHFAACLAWY